MIPIRLTSILFLLLSSLLSHAEEATVRRKYFMYAAVYEPTGKPQVADAREVINTVQLMDGSYQKLKSQFNSEVRKKYTASNSTYAILFVPTSEYGIVFSFKMKKFGGIAHGIGVAEGKTKEEAETQMAHKLKLASGYDSAVMRRWPTAEDLKDN